MALVMTRGEAASPASNTTKTSILADVENIIQRVSRIARGEAKFMDANLKQTSAALKRLQEAKGFLSSGLIPTSTEQA